MSQLVLNTPVDVVIFVLECIAAASFSVSGTICAIAKRTDFVGALIFAFVTVFGGGFIRDLVIGRNPPLLLSSMEYAILAAICLVVSISVFLIAFIPNVAGKLTAGLHNAILEASDMVGLALFCILGVDSALAAPVSAGNTALLIFCGCMTGVGGGILRDVLSAQIPLLFRKHIYFIPALLGTVCYVLMLPHTHRLLAILVSVSIILILRILAVRFRWNLPTPLGKNPKPEKETSRHEA